MVYWTRASSRQFTRIYRTFRDNLALDNGKMGEKCQKDKLQKAKHGRAADLLIALMVFHSFLGFLYIFDVV